jgi:hypothetical protein
VGRDRHGHGQRQGRALIDDLDSLFAAAPAGFIEERKRIAAALKSAGRRDEAKAVEKIPRPSVAVWTVNQIARRDPEMVRRLGEITERLQRARGPEYGAAAAELREVLAQLRDQAGDVLRGAGHDAGPHLVQRVIANLRAAAGSAETRPTLEQGRLVRDVEEQDMVSLFGAAAETTGAARPAHAKQAKAEPNASDATSAAHAKAEQRARAKEIAAAQREVKRLRDADATARKSAARAERAVTDARDELAAAEKRLSGERAAADAAAHALAQAEADLARLTS